MYEVRYEVRYAVRYDDDGNAAGAERLAERLADRLAGRAPIRETSAGFDALYGHGEEFHSFFDREIAPRAAPAVAD